MVLSIKFLMTVSPAVLASLMEMGMATSAQSCQNNGSFLSHAMGAANAALSRCAWPRMFNRHPKIPIGGCVPIVYQVTTDRNDGMRAERIRSHLPGSSDIGRTFGCGRAGREQKACGWLHNRQQRAGHRTPKSLADGSPARASQFTVAKILPHLLRTFLKPFDDFGVSVSYICRFANVIFEIEQ